MLDFDSIVSPLGREKFLREHWTHSYARIQGQAGRFADLINWDELNAVLAHHRLTSPRLLLFRENEPVDPARYITSPSMGSQRVDSGGLAVALAEGATLILTDVQEVSPKLRALMQVFQDSLRTGAFANLYAAWHAQKAFDLHWDPQETFVLQVSGRKRWKVYRPTRVHPLEHDIEKPARPTADPVWEGVLRDGDVLYIPRGWWHVALPLNEPSLHLSVSLNPPKFTDMLEWALSNLRHDIAVRTDVPALKDEQIRTAQMNAVRTALESALSGNAMNDFLAQWEGNIAHTPHIDVMTAAYGQFAAIDNDSRLRLATLHKLTLTPFGDNFEFTAAGRLWTVPRALAPALERLHNTHTVTVADLSALLSSDAEREDLRKSLGVLARSGVVLVDKPS